MRIFIALLFDDENNDKIFSCTKTLKEHSASGNFSSYNNLHLTMLFIGQTDPDMVKKIYDKLLNIKSNAFKYHSGNIGYFSKSRNRKILYLGLKDTYRIKELHVKIVAKINELGMNFNVNKFTPHITLGREVLLKDDFDPNIYKVESLELKAKNMSIMESTRVNGKLVYKELYSIPLK